MVQKARYGKLEFRAATSLTKKILVFPKKADFIASN